MISYRPKLLHLRHSLSKIIFSLNFQSCPLQNRLFSPKPLNPNNTLNPNPRNQHPSPNSTTTHFNSSYTQPVIEINPLNYDHDTVLETLTRYSNDWQRALQLFNWVKTEFGFEHTTETYNRMIDILGKGKRFDICWDLIEDMRKGSSFWKPSHVTFRVLFKRYASAHLVNEAISSYYKLGVFNLRDELSFSNLIEALCDYKHVTEAENICLGKNVDKGLAFNVKDAKIYCIILHGWSKMGWWSKCREFWEEMDRRGVCKDLHSYSIYMDIQCKRGKPWKALELYKEMKTKGIKLDAVAYDKVIGAICLSEGVDFATCLYCEMIELGHEPNVATYNTVIKILCKNGRVKEANEVLAQMCVRGCLPNVITYHSIFSYLESSYEILDLFEMMMRSGVRPRIDTYVMLMRKFGRLGCIGPVIEVWDKMLEHGVSPDMHSYNALIDVLVETGDLDMARKYGQEMVAKGLSAKNRVVL